MNEFREIVLHMIGSDWKRFGRLMLNYDDDLLDSIDIDENRVADKTNRIMTHFIKENGRQEFISHVFITLEEMPRYDIIRKLKNMPNFEIVSKIHSSNQARKARTELTNMFGGDLVEVPDEYKGHSKKDLKILYKGENVDVIETSDSAFILTGISDDSKLLDMANKEIIKLKSDNKIQANEIAVFKNARIHELVRAERLKSEIKDNNIQMSEIMALRDKLVLKGKRFEEKIEELEDKVNSYSEELIKIKSLQSNSDEVDRLNDELHKLKIKSSGSYDDNYVEMLINENKNLIMNQKLSDKK